MSATISPTGEPPPPITPIAAFVSGMCDGLRTDRLLSISEWSDQNIVLSTKDGPEQGPFRTSRTPYVREILECLAPTSKIERVVWVAGSQIAKTRTGLNWIGYSIDVSPGPILIVQPTVGVAHKVSKQRVAPMIANTACLRAKVSESRSRDSGNTILAKEFPGGMLMIGGANSAAELSSMPIRDLFLDEVDRYPLDVEEEGDPVGLAEARTSNFSRRKIFMTSTPTIKGLSRIESEFLQTDQRRYFVPCPHCGFKDWMRWDRIQWPEGKPLEAKLLCTACGVLIEERHKTKMLADGEWRPTAACNDERCAGFHLSALYSPLGWKSWAMIVREFLAAKGEPAKLKKWVNTVLGETWEERGDQVDADALKNRLEDYPAEVPTGVGILTASVDVQGDRLELAVKGWGAGEESWLVALHQVHGDPAKETTWFELDKMLLERYTTESGRKIAASCVAIDSGGLHTDQVYKFCKPRQVRRIAGELQHVYAIKGIGGAGREIVGRPTTGNRYHLKLFPVGVDTAKDTIFSRMHLAVAGPGYLHLPAWADDEYLAQLTSEKAIRKYKRGVGAIREYTKIRERNEGLDLEVYSLAALYILGRQLIASLGRLAQELATPGDKTPTPTGGGNTPPSTPGGSWMGGRGGSGWINRW